MNLVFGNSARCISAGVCMTLAPLIATAQPSSSTPAELKAELPNIKPAWVALPRGADHYVNSVAVSADGQRVVAGTFYNHYPTSAGRRGQPNSVPTVALPAGHDRTFGTYCYDASGRLQWKDEFQSEEGVYWVAISADGSHVASGGSLSASRDVPLGFVRAYDAAGHEMLYYHPSTMRRVNQVSLSGDGKWLVAAAGKLFLFKLGTASYAAPVEFPSPGGESIVSASISQDGGIIVYSDYAGWIGVLQNNGGVLTPVAKWQVPKLSAQGNFCHMIDLAPDGKTFAAGGSGGEFYFFDVAKFIATQTPTLTYKTGIEGAVYGVAGAPDGSIFAGVVDDGDLGKAYAVPVGNGPVAAAVPSLALKHNPNSAAFNISGGFVRLAIADGHPDGHPGDFYFFSSPVGSQPLMKLRWIFHTDNMSWPIVISASGNAVVGGSDDSHIYYFTP